MSFVNKERIRRRLVDPKSTRPDASRRELSSTPDPGPEGVYREEETLGLHKSSHNKSTTFHPHVLLLEWVFLCEVRR